MKVPFRPMVWSVFALAGCLLVPFGIHWFEAQMDFALIKGPCTMYNIFFPGPLIGGIVVCFLFVSFSIWQAKGRFSSNTVLVAGAIAFFYGGFAWFIAPDVGRPLYQYYLDAFSERVVASNVESNAVAWAEQILNDKSLNPKHSQSINVQAPSFFNPVFGKMAPPEATVNYSNDGMEPGFVDIHVEAGSVGKEILGIVVLKNPAMAQDWTGPEVRHCGNRLLIYYDAR